jgi:hypothetical protein
MLKEKDTVSGRFPSPILTNACGVDVTISFTGTVTRLTGPKDLELANIAVIFSAGANQVRFRSASLARREPQADGTVLLTISGRTVEFTGLQVKIELGTGDTIMINEPHVTDLDSICKRLKN